MSARQADDLERHGFALVFTDDGWIQMLARHLPGIYTGKLACFKVFETMAQVILCRLGHRRAAVGASLVPIRKARSSSHRYQGGHFGDVFSAPAIDNWRTFVVIDRMPFAFSGPYDHRGECGSPIDADNLIGTLYQQ